MLLRLIIVCLYWVLLENWLRMISWKMHLLVLVLLHHGLVVLSRRLDLVLLHHLLGLVMLSRHLDLVLLHHLLGLSVLSCHLDLMLLHHLLGLSVLSCHLDLMLLHHLLGLALHLLELLLLLWCRNLIWRKHLLMRLVGKVVVGSCRMQVESSIDTWLSLLLLVAMLWHLLTTLLDLACLQELLLHLGGSLTNFLMVILLMLVERLVRLNAFLIVGFFLRGTGLRWSMILFLHLKISLQHVASLV